jgi:DNA-binding LacI/PurR family transcriptional regulator
MGDMARRTTIDDLAARAGGRVSTTDRMMNGRDKVWAETVAKEMLAVKKLQVHRLPTLRERLQPTRSKARLGFLLQLSLPIPRLAKASINQMLGDIQNQTPPGKRIGNFEIFGPENL